MRCWTRAIVGELHAALDDCNKALTLSPQLVDALDSRGFVYLKLGEYDRAIAEYDEVLKIAPTYAGSLFGRGLAKLKKGLSGDSDIAAAKAINPNIGDDFASYGVK
jgi:tetratricopeptide (TPR) repeat protein